MSESAHSGKSHEGLEAEEVGDLAPEQLCMETKAGGEMSHKEAGVCSPLEKDNSGLGHMLSRTVSAVTTSTARDPGPPPDGGTTAWTQVAMGHLVIFGTWGYISSFGVFQTYYVSALGHPPSDISWVGSIQIWLLFFIGTISGRATDAGLFRPVFITGAIIQCLGLFMTSLCTEYWQLVLAQGICTGFGNGLQFCPTISLITTYFSKRRAMGLGVVACGSATGGLVYPAVVQQLLPRIGLPWTMRVLGFMSLAIFSLTAAFLRTRLPPRKSGPLVEWNAFKEAPFVLCCLGMFFCFWSIYFGFYYVGSYGRDIIGFSYSDSISLLMIMNGVGVPGRLIPNYLSDRAFGPVNTIIPYAFLAGVLFFAWAGVDSRAGLYAYAAIYGIFAAGIQSLLPVSLASLTEDMKRQGTRLGMGFSIISIAVLTGPPLAGALIQADDGGYLYAQMWAGVFMVCGGLTLFAARIAKTGFKLRMKV